MPLWSTTGESWLWRSSKLRQGGVYETAKISDQPLKQFGLFWADCLQKVPWFLSPKAQLVKLGLSRRMVRKCNRNFKKCFICKYQQKGSAGTAEHWEVQLYFPNISNVSLKSSLLGTQLKYFGLLYLYTKEKNWNKTHLQKYQFQERSFPTFAEKCFGWKRVTTCIIALGLES